MIDSHCHIGFDCTADETAALVARAHGQGVTHMLTVACSFDNVPQLKSVLVAHSSVFGAFGIHPENAADFDKVKFMQVFQEMPELVAVGEIGLDYYYNNDTRDIQKDVFFKQIELADQLNKPVIIHTRDAEDDTMDILETAARNNWLKRGGVLHCYTGSLNLAKRAIELGFYVSASGIITFKNSQPLRDVFKELPLDRLLVETDAPYLAPVPFRGKVNEPSFLPNTLNKLAELKEVNPDEVQKITTHNFKTLFGISDEN